MTESFRPTAAVTAHIRAALVAMVVFAQRHELEVVECKEVGERRSTDYEMWVAMPGRPELLACICLFASRGPAFGYVGTQGVNLERIVASAFTDNEVRGLAGYDTVDGKDEFPPVNPYARCVSSRYACRTT